jgi:2'-5' RNA ligase
MPRLFVAIDLPESVRDDIGDIYEAIHGARWTPENQLHLTLRFIGDVDGKAAADIDSALRKIKFEPFNMRLKSTGFFPPRGEPRILWCGVEANDELMRLRKHIERALVTEAKLPSDPKKFHPHITIARLNGSPPQKLADFMTTNALFESEEFEVPEFCLYSSVLKRDGALHIKETQYKFFGAGAQNDVYL